jgi:hypothetical protein
LVLAIAKNLQSFEDLWMFEGIIYPIIHKTCLAHGLLKDDDEWHHCLEDTTPFQMSHILLSLFIIILHVCAPTHPVSLWKTYKEFLCNNLTCVLAWLGMHNAHLDIVHNYRLYLIQESLLWETNQGMKDIINTLVMCRLMRRLDLSLEMQWQSMSGCVSCWGTAKNAARKGNRSGAT